jgi:hypothetical protein
MRPMLHLALAVVTLMPGLAAAQDPAPRPQPPPLPRSNIQVNITGGASVLTTVTAGDRRTLLMREGSEKIELQEREGGKEIVLRHERPVNGAMKRDEYKAADLDALKTQHADADLYRRITERAKNQPPRAAPIRVPGPNGALQFALPNRQTPQPGEGTRRLSAVVQGQRVTIDDRYGAQIEITVTKTVDGQPQTENYSAADLATLKKERPELAALYRRLTGLN